MRKKTSRSDNDEVVRLDGEIVLAQATKSDLERKLEADTNAHDAAAARRNEVAYLALTENDPGSLQELEEIEATLTKIDQRIASTRIAVSVADTKIIQLEKRRMEAFQEAKRSEYTSETDTLIEEAQRAETALRSMIEAKAILDARLRNLDALALAAGMADGAHRNISKNIRRSLAHRLNYDETWLTRHARQFYSLPLGAVVRRVLDGGAIDENPQQEAVND